MAPRLDKESFGDPVKPRQEEAETKPKARDYRARQANEKRSSSAIASIKKPSESA
jgi:hypothetical protein